MGQIGKGKNGNIKSNYIRSIYGFITTTYVYLRYIQWLSILGVIMKTNEKQRCPKCNYLRIGRLFYCPKCGHKYENEIPYNIHPTTYKKCMDCRYFTKDTRKSKLSSYGYCECPQKKFRYEGNAANWYQRTRKACKHFEEKI